MSEAIAVVSGSIAGGTCWNLGFSVVAPPWLAQSGDPLPCRVDPDLFFPDSYMQRKQVDAARAVCEACPMRLTCLEWAVSRPDLDGIWAATTPPERRRLRTGKAA